MFVFVNPRNITIQGLFIKVTILNIYPNFLEYVLSKIQIYIIPVRTLLIYFRSRFSFVFHPGALS